MSVSDHQTSLLAEINKALTTLDRVKALSSKLYDTDFDSSEGSIGESVSILHEILDLCGEANEYLESSQQHSEAITSILGINLLLSSLLPTIKLIAFTAADSSLIYNPDTDQRLSDLKQNPISDFYSKPPKNKVLGDLGELTVLKMLIDPKSKDQLSEQEVEEIQTKPLLSSQVTDRMQNPDFYLPSRHLIIDSKAWKNLGKTSIDKVIEKYVNLECLNQGGEVRLYFPSDTYQQYKALLEKIPDQIKNVKVSTVPMEVTYDELVSEREIMFMFLKSLILPKKLKG